MATTTAAPGADVLSRARQALATGALEYIGGFEAHVYRFHGQQGPYILRLTHDSHRTEAEIESELAFVTSLADAGGRVCRIVERGGRQVHRFGAYLSAIFSEAPGGVIEAPHWGPDLWSDWGEAIGLFHHVASAWAPPPGFVRPRYQDDENFDFDNRLPANQSKVREIAAREMARLAGYPTASDVYGVIHGDAHAGNFFRAPDGRLTFFDFDDACWHWYGYDIATVVFGAVLQPWVGESQAEREREAARFYRAFREGYERQFPMTVFSRDRMRDFLKLRELSLYGVVNTFFDVDNLTDWFPRRFMAGRRERIEAGRPYLDISFD